MVTEYLVVLKESEGSEYIKRDTFKEAVKMYRFLTEIYGSKVEIYQKVVSCGETI